MTTHEETIDAVILHQAPYKESGALIVIYSREFGKLSLIAQGVKKLTSKNAPSVLPLTLSELTIIPRSGLSRLIRGQAKRYYLHIKDHIQYEITASYLLEYYYRYEEENDPSEEAYQFLVAALEALENGYDYHLIYCMINVFIMKRNGVMLEMDGCVHCGSLQVAGFSLENGGFTCRKHMSAHDFKMDKEDLKALRHIYKRKITEIDLIDLHEVDFSLIIPIFEHFVEENCGIYLKTKSFIKQIMS